MDTAYASAQPLGLLLAAWLSIKFATWVAGRLSPRQSLTTLIRPALIRALLLAFLWLAPLSVWESQFPAVLPLFLPPPISQLEPRFQIPWEATGELASCALPCLPN